MYELHTGDSAEILKTMPDNSVDSIVTDPPYGLSFMGKKWDYDVPGVDVWAECLRVLKPGGHLLAFAGTRTQHRMAVRIEDAGFEIRDMIAWIYGSGFPKSKNLADKWQGWGTALKPSLEPVTVARKPLIGTVAENVLAHGTGAINVDGCRVDSGGVTESSARAGKGAGHDAHNKDGRKYGDGLGGVIAEAHPLGRWPANLIHDGSDEVLAGFPDAKGQQGALTGAEPSSKTKNVLGEFAGRAQSEPRGDTGSAARFFYAAKASKRDRGEGNNHPTVKPTDLMRYLCRLVTPPGGVVLDPFMGSGSTGKAAMLEGFRFVGIDREAEYVAISQARIAAAFREFLGDDL